MKSLAVFLAELPPIALGDADPHPAIVTEASWPSSLDDPIPDWVSGQPCASPLTDLGDCLRKNYLYLLAMTPMHHRRALTALVRALRPSSAFDPLVASLTLLSRTSFCVLSLRDPWP